MIITFMFFQHSCTKILNISTGILPATETFKLNILVSFYMKSSWNYDWMLFSRLLIIPSIIVSSDRHTLPINLLICVSYMHFYLVYKIEFSFGQ